MRDGRLGDPTDFERQREPERARERAGGGKEGGCRQGGGDNRERKGRWGGAEKRCDLICNRRD